MCSGVASRGQKIESSSSSSESLSEGPEDTGSGLATRSDGSSSSKTSDEPRWVAGSPCGKCGTIEWVPVGRATLFTATWPVTTDNQQTKRKVNNFMLNEAIAVICRKRRK